MLNRLIDSLNFQAQALSLRAERQRILASNIANADTPGYQAREMDFAAALREATGGGNPAARLAPARAAPRGDHLPMQPGEAGPTALRYATASQTSLDSNSVDMDRERASFADNAVHYEATLRFLNGSVKTLTSAITGQ